jgi:AcrR family transcriptional regulator
MQEDRSTKTDQPRSKRTRADKRRQELVAAAYQIIAQRGFEGLRVREVAARAGVNIATLHYYFDTKGALVRGVVEQLLHQFITVTAPVADQSQDTAPQQLRGLFTDLQYQLQEVPDMFVVLTELHLRSQRDPEIQAALQGLTAGWHAHIRQICVEGTQRGQLRANLDPDLAASLLVALIKGMSLQASSGLDRFDFDRMSAEVVGWFIAPRASVSTSDKGGST